MEALADKDCEGCRYAVGYECRRYPPQMVQRKLPDHMMPEYEAIFPWSGTRCGEYSAEATRADLDALQAKMREALNNRPAP